MLVALLVAACVAPAAPDWVEISQQHYRKPTRYTPARPTFYPADDTRPHNHPDDIRRPAQNPMRLPPAHVEDEALLENLPDEDKIVYSNHSISEHNWNQNKHRVPGGIRRVDTNNIKLKANVTPQFSLEVYGEVTESAPESVTTNVLKDRETASATVERVSNKGSVKRVQLSNSPVKSPIVKNVVNPIRTNNVRQPGLTTMVDGFSDEIEITSDIFRNEKEVIALTPADHVKHVFSGINYSPVTDYDRIITSTDWPTSEPSIPFQRYPQIKHSHKSHTIKETDNSNIKNISAVKQNPFPSTNIKTTAIQTKNIYANENEIAEKNLNFITTSEKIKEPGDDEFEKITTNRDLKNSGNFNNNPVRIDALNAPKSQNTKQNNDANSNGEKNTNEQFKANEGKNKINEGIRVNTMETVMKFMKVVADTISKNTRRGVGGKVKYLNELKQTLLRSIQDRIEATWPDDTSAGARRLSRPQRDTARGHVEFPSSESALMTISFLTFAVFLIKLVLQVIHTYKNKAMMVAPLVVASAGRTVRKLRDFH